MDTPPNRGRWPDADLPRRVVCLTCRTSPPITKTAAEIAAAQSGGRLVAEECAYGLGWHLNDTGPTGDPGG